MKTISCYLFLFSIGSIGMKYSTLTTGFHSKTASSKLFIGKNILIYYSLIASTLLAIY